MKLVILVFFLILSFSLTLRAQTYYIVRHAEKAVNDSSSMMNNDPPLSAEGRSRAEALKKQLRREKIDRIFSTNTVRTRSTAEPISKAKHVNVQFYGPRPDSIFITQLKNLAGKTLIVGHSNTVDDIVNGLCGEPLLNDLPDAAYDNLFIVTKENGKYLLKQEKFGKKVPVRTSSKRE